jgi:hypothetical protein
VGFLLFLFLFWFRGEEEMILDGKQRLLFERGGGFDFILFYFIFGFFLFLIAVRGVIV